VLSFPGVEKNLSSLSANKKKKIEDAKTRPEKEKKHHSKKHRVRNVEASPVAAFTPRTPSEKISECLTSPPASPDKVFESNISHGIFHMLDILQPTSVPSVPVSSRGPKEEDKMLAERRIKQLPRKCSVVMEKVDLSQYLVQDENAEETASDIAMERTPKRKLSTKAGHTDGKKSKKTSTAATPQSPARPEDNVVLFDEVLDISIEVNNFF
jgi:hypothetical protein